MYLRLFIVMGMTYSISGISYLITRNSIFSEWTEIILSLQGVWIFILFILKPRVFVLMRKRFVFLRNEKAETPHKLFVFSDGTVQTPAPAKEAPKLIREMNQIPG